MSNFVGIEAVTMILLILEQLDFNNILIFLFNVLTSLTLIT